MPSAAEVADSGEATADVTTRVVPRRRGLIAVIASLAILLWGVDQLTKLWAVATLDPRDPPSYLGGFLTLRLVRNPGAAFSLGTSVTPVFTLLASAALIYCVGFLSRKIVTLGGAIVTGLAIAGIAGNLTDRLVRPPGFAHGHVIDFLQIPNWAIFNVADMCIVATAVLVGLGLVRDLIGARPPQSASRAETTDGDPADS